MPTTMTFTLASPDLITQLAGIVGAAQVLTDPVELAPFLTDWRGRYRGHARCLVRPGEFLRAADLELDVLRRRVNRAGKRIDLTSKEFGLLELLMRRQGEVLPRSLIASQVWDMNFDSDTNVIEVAMRRLRLKVDDGQSVKLIQTVRGMGYVLEAAQEP